MCEKPQDTGKYKGMVNLQERYMENVMDVIVGVKVEPIGQGIDTLGDAERATWTSGRNIGP